MTKREELLALKQKYWDKGDYEAVKKVRSAIKEWDRAHPKVELTMENWEEMYEAEEDLEKKLEMLVEAHEKGWIK